MRRPHSPAETDRVVRLAKQGMTAPQIAKATGIPRSTVYRWLNPAYAELARRRSREAKRRRVGVCRSCGGPTRLNDSRTARRHPTGASLICGSCAKREQHEQRYWTRERIIDRLLALNEFLGRPPTTCDAVIWGGGNPSMRARFSAARIAEAEAIPEALRPPLTAIVLREFGSWGAARQAAGLPATVPTGAAAHRRPESLPSTRERAS